MAFDFKKEYKDLYLPKTKPELIDVPPMSFIAVAGTGNPNEENGSYAGAMGLLYAFSYTVKMSKMGAWQPDGYFDYTVPPLEGLWWTSDEAFDGQRILDKDALSWISLIRQPDFVTPEVFAWAAEQVAAKKPELDLRRARLVRFAEGPCAQIMHKGPYDDEPATVAAIGALTIPAMVERGYDKYFSAALVAAAGCVGVMIPPSNPFVVYGISAQVSIGDLFMSGIVPGIMVGIVLMSYCIGIPARRWRGQEKVRNARTSCTRLGTPSGRSWFRSSCSAASTAAS